MGSVSRLAILPLGIVMLSAAAPNRVLTGVWSGPQATLTLDATGGSLIESCQTTTLAGPVRVAADGRFVAAASREVHDGGPQRADAAPTLIAVRLAGRVGSGGVTIEAVAPGTPTMTATLVPGRRFKSIRCY